MVDEIYKSDSSYKDTERQLEEMLDQAFNQGAEEMKRRGFKRRVGFGTRPAVIHIDMANAWTRPDHAFTCRNMDTIIPACQDLNAAARAKGVPVIFITTTYEVLDTSLPSDMGLWSQKIPLETLDASTGAADIDSRIAPQEGELVITKKRASAFPGTYLNQFLTANRIDTLIVTGVTASACVRNTVEDAMAEGFRPIVVREAVGDRVAGTVAWNLFDIDNKFGDVENLSTVVDYLSNLPNFEDTVPTPAAQVVEQHAPAAEFAKG
ncbi:isochorismatase family protein [Brevibacterium ravenspurgense]|uniref:isochorismatase family protein n=1 Tax=Brevibacterium ravenspurgense TaxID=479117 RepID=UPI001EF1FF35|nr:isochorismatase family protein [Brevibacterium ravenspurgense]MCG7300266.1 isochorismatase family protein [Brevibacterium ravenspurgense]